MAEQERLNEKNQDQQTEERPENAETSSTNRLAEESFSDSRARSTASSPSKSESGENGPKSKELVFGDPFKAAAQTAEGPRLRTVLPGPVAEQKEAPAKDPANEKDGVKVVQAVVLAPVKAPAPADAAEPKKNLSTPESDGFKRPEADSLSTKAAERMKGVKDFSDWINKSFEFLDADKDGTLTEKEAATAMTNEKIANGANAPYLNALYNNIESLSSELGGEGAKGLNKDGLAALSRLAEDKEFFRKGDRALAVRDLEKVMNHFDKNRNGDLTPAETREAAERKDLTPEQTQALKDLQAYQHHKINKDYGKTQKDENGEDLIMQDFGGAIGMTPRKHMGDLRSWDVAGYASGLERTAENISYSMKHANDRLEGAKKDPSRISQGTDGSCFFLAPLMGMKDHDPKVMDKMIKDNGNGTHTVTFPGKPDAPITVKTPTDAEMSGWANGKQAAIMEKAFADHYVKDIASQMELSDENQEKLKAPVPSSRILGGNTKDAIKLLTGKDAEVKNLDEISDADLRQTLKSAEENKTAIAADTGYYRSHPGLVNRHSYKARYDAASDTVTLENPVKPGREKENSSSYPYEPFKVDRSATDGKDDGIFKMSFADFKKNFARISYPKD